MSMTCLDQFVIFPPQIIHDDAIYRWQLIRWTVLGLCAAVQLQGCQCNRKSMWQDASQHTIVASGVETLNIKSRGARVNGYLMSIPIFVWFSIPPCSWNLLYLFSTLSHLRGFLAAFIPTQDHWKALISDETSEGASKPKDFIYTLRAAAGC